MTVNEIKELLNNVTDDMEIFVTHNATNKGFVIRVKEKEKPKTNKTHNESKSFPDYYNEVVNLKMAGHTNKYISEKYNISVGLINDIVRKVKKHNYLMENDKLYHMLKGNTRAYNSLKRSGVATITDLINHFNSGTNFANEVRNCGIETQLYIEKCIKEYLREEEK